ncbi:hypothetical protein NJB93_19610 [Brucella intermedia]|uniref:hypothetical protein n=1 Tax=Brucella intermedia TaxID=94625 RepID=UPI00209A7A54|nr:hypothetical protein [Brucella intermedia]MCO7728790.1 hypothetical protein [Brucella intermedia]
MNQPSPKKFSDTLKGLSDNAQKAWEEALQAFREAQTVGHPAYFYPSEDAR